MTRLATKVTKKPAFRIGLNGNYYVYCADRLPLVGICEAMGKSPGSIYWNDKHRCWAIRVKCKGHKERLRKDVVL